MYRTNYYPSLENIYNRHKAKGNKAPYNYLPERGVIYTGDVSVFRKTESEGFEFMPKPKN